ncbi:MAG: hypothetical protein H7842_12820 [Gammaproteobacteria bacterium SHHR-1]
MALAFVRQQGLDLADLLGFGLGGVGAFADLTLGLQSAEVAQFGHQALQLAPFHGAAAGLAGEPLLPGAAGVVVHAQGGGALVHEADELVAR